MDNVIGMAENKLWDRYLARRDRDAPFQRLVAALPESNKQGLGLIDGPIRDIVERGDVVMMILDIVFILSPYRCTSVSEMACDVATRGSRCRYG